MTLSEHWARLRERRWFKPAVTVLLVGAIFVFSADAVFAFPPDMNDLLLFMAQVAVTVLNLIATLVSEVMRLLILVMVKVLLTGSLR